MTKVTMEIVGASDVPSYDIEDNDNNFEPTITQRLDKLEWYTRKLFKGDVDFAEMTAAQLLAMLAVQHQTITECDWRPKEYWTNV